MMVKKIVLACVVILATSLWENAWAQNRIAPLVRNLLQMGYPLTKEDVLALDKIGMKFNAGNRLTVLKKILSDRDRIHRLKTADYFVKTEVICDALRLVDELNLPVVKTLVEHLERQSDWETREKMVLAYMAARRDIRYQANVDFLLGILPQYESDLDRIYSGDFSWAIIDVMRCLSFLTDLFVYKGDKDIFNALSLYSARAYGFQSEYLSHMFLDMLLIRPYDFVGNLATQEATIIRAVTNSLLFGIRSHMLRAKVEKVLRQELSEVTGPAKSIVILLKDKVHNQASRNNLKTAQE
jgi:hypothetical protein